MSATATNLYELPSTDEAKAQAEEMKASAVAHFEAIKGAAVPYAVSSLTIGWHGHKIKSKNLLGILGFESEDQIYKAAGIEKSTWYSVVRLAEKFDGLSLEQFISMKLTNAKLLADLPEPKRMSREWVRLAGSMKTEKFAIKVDQELDGKARESDTKEKGVVLKIDMPLSRKTVVEEGLKEYGEKIGVAPDDPGKALEVLVAEKKGETSLIESITNAIQYIRQAKEIKNSGLSADEALEKVYGILDEMVIGLRRCVEVFPKFGIRESVIRPKEKSYDGIRRKLSPSAKGRIGQMASLSPKTNQPKVNCNRDWR